MPNPSSSHQTLTITYVGQKHQVPVDREFVFGRSGDLVIDADNRLLHRQLGRLLHVNGLWYLHNCGQTIPLIITDDSSPSYARLAPGSRMPLPYTQAAITFSAGSASYRLCIEQPRNIDSVTSEICADLLSRTDEQTISLQRLRFNEEQLAVLKLLAEPRLKGPITSSDLPSNKELAQTLGWTLPKLVRKLDHLCAKLDRAGVNGLAPSPERTAQERRVILANTVVENGLLDNHRQALSYKPV